MNITSAEFVLSSPELSKCPKPDKPEFAFIGRSNVGKSSLINMLCNHSGLARTSARPGKTQLINHFLANKTFYIVDLPGYGYAKVAKSKRAEFDKMISNYIMNRENLICVFVLVDVRLEPQQIDRDFMAHLAENGIAFVILFTKCDKLSQNELKSHVANYKKVMSDEWEEFPHYILTSAEKKTGRDEVIAFMEENMQYFQK